VLFGVATMGVLAYDAEMASEISGRITRILIANDQDVEKGAPLLLIDPPISCRCGRHGHR
jgi:multidrug resistance efflux pump